MYVCLCVSLLAVLKILPLLCRTRRRPDDGDAVPWKQWEALRCSVSQLILQTRSGIMIKKTVT